jgi:hypothetical protein
MVGQEFMADPVQLVSCHAGRHVPADLRQGLCGDPSGNPHPLDGLGVLHVRLARARAAPADILRTGDGIRHASLRRNPARLENGRHDLQV